MILEENSTPMVWDDKTRPEECQSYSQDSLQGRITHTRSLRSDGVDMTCSDKDEPRGLVRERQTTDLPVPLGPNSMTFAR